MRIDDAQVALCVAQHMSFTNAAEELGMSNSKVSRIITELEHENNHAIFSRTTRRMAITPYGEVFLRHAQTLVSTQQHIIEEMAAVAAGHSGVLHIGYSSNVNVDILPSIIKQCAQDMPKVSLKPSFAWSQANVENINDGFLDVAFLTDAAPTPGMEYIKVADKVIYFLMAENHPLANKQRLYFDDVKDEPFITGPENKWRAMGNMLKHYFDSRNHVLKVAFETDDPQSMETLTRLGVGLSVNYSLPGTPLAPGLVRKPIADDTTSFPVYMQWRSNNSNPALHKFLALVETMANQGW